MKRMLFLLLTIILSLAVNAQNPRFDQQFRDFRFYFENTPQPSQISAIAVGYPACRRPYSEDFSTGGFPTLVEVNGDQIKLTYSFWVPNGPGCLSGLVRYYPLPAFNSGQYRITVVAQFILEGNPIEPPRLLEARTMAQINFQVGEPLATQVPSLTPVGFALMSLMMLGVGAYVSGRRYS